MKKLLLLLLLIATQNSFSQNKAEIKELFWGKSDPYNKVTSVPEKWKNESAVIIYKSENYDYHKFGSSVTYTSSIRKRIKLQDNAVVKEFSEFSFKDKFYSNKGYYKRAGSNTVGIKIVKPDGKEIEIDVEKDAKEVDKEKKIAIANLEVGDIIDFYYHSVEPFKSTLEFGFEPVETPFRDIYPTMEFKLSFHTENDFFVNFNTYNGAPELKEILNKGGKRDYELSATDIPKNEFPRWFYALNELPCYKFQVFFARSGKFEKRAEAFLSENENVVKKTVSKEDIFNYYNEKFRPYGDLGQIFKFIKGKTFSSDEEKVREVYYFTRHQYYTQYVEAFVANEANLFYPFALYDNPIFFNTEEAFINHFMAFLKESKINYEIIVGTAKFNGSIEDLLIQKNVTVLLKVNTEKPLYLEFFTPFSSADQFNYLLENTKAYALQVSKGRRVVDSELITLPATTAKDNVSKTISTITLTDGMSDLKIKRNCSYSGHMKEDEQSEKLKFYDFVNEDYSKYGTEPLIDRVRNKKKQTQYRSEFDALIKKYKDNMTESAKKRLSEEFGFEIDDNTLEIKNTGRFGSKEPFVYDEEFTIQNNLIKKAGENYVLEIGKILTSQVELDKKDKERKANIYMPFPRTIDNEIILEIPAGYTVSGLDKLTKNVTSETGGFTSNASISGNKLIIKTSKFYNNYYESNANWQKMVQFLDVAYQFSQEKILLKKA